MSTPEQPLSRLQMWLMGALALLCALLIFLVLYACHQRQAAKAWKTQAEQAQKREEQRVATAKEIDAKAVDAQALRRKAEEESQRREAVFQATPLPPTPKPAPVEDFELTKGLETAGMTPGLALFHPGPSSLNRTDAVLIWNWSQEASQVPLLKTRLEAAESLVDGRAQETKALKTENLLAYQSRDAWKDAHQVADERAEALQKEVKALHREATAVEGGVAVVLTAFIVRSLVRR